MILRELSPEECSRHLEGNRLARLACSREGQPYVVPLHYVFTQGSVYAFTLAGRKLETMRANPKVALLVETHGPRHTWTSVLAEGDFEELPDRIGHKRERDHAWALLSRHADWWEPGALKAVLPPMSAHGSEIFFRVHVQRLSGRQALEE
jgi:uncharacterized protein